MPSSRRPDFLSLVVNGFVVAILLGGTAAAFMHSGAVNPAPPLEELEGFETAPDGGAFRVAQESPQSSDVDKLPPECVGVDGQPCGPGHPGKAGSVPDVCQGSDEGRLLHCPAFTVAGERTERQDGHREREQAPDGDGEGGDRRHGDDDDEEENDEYDGDDDDEEERDDRKSRKPHRGDD